VASHAALRDFFRLYPFEVEYLGFVAASLNVRSACSMARLAAVDFLAPNLFGCTYPEMGAGFNALACFVMTTFAGVRPDVLRRIGLSGFLVCGAGLLGV
jgi:hypothetical protein